ncbi:MAG: GIY-YIG nuclease family protein [Deltaproteobacteria bacterium]|nr:GIY-YIG nuclease family protein [Deltaproteobacteria bacterium]
MPYWVYISQNDTSGKLYKGQTSDLKRRIERHNTHESGSMRYTHKQKGTWQLIFSEKFSNRSEAMTREKFFKNGHGREWIKTNILDQQFSCLSPPQADWGANIYKARKSWPFLL